MKHRACVSVDTVSGFCSKVREYGVVTDNFGNVAASAIEAELEFCEGKVNSFSALLDAAREMLSEFEDKRKALNEQKEEAEAKIKRTPKTITTSDSEGNLTETYNKEYEKLRKKLQETDAKLKKLTDIIGQIKDIVSALEREKGQLVGYLNSIQQKGRELADGVKNIKSDNERAERALKKTEEAIGAYLSVDM